MVSRALNKVFGIPTQQLLKWFIILLSLMVMGLAFIHPGLRKPDGWPDPMAWIIALWGLALSIVAISWQTPWYKSGRLTGIAIYGQACALAILMTPNYGVLQHYLDWPELLSSPSIIFLSGPIIQSIVAIHALRKVDWGQLLWTRNLFSLPQVAIIVAVLTFSAANFLRNPFIYIGEVLLAVWIFLVSGANWLLVAASFPQKSLEKLSQLVEKAFEQKRDQPVGISKADRYLPVLLAIWVFAISAAISWFVLERVPHIPDSVAFLTQAKYFAAGKLYLPAPPVEEAFDLIYLINDGTKVYTYSFLGWPALLAVGLFVGTPWLVNPILAATTVLLMHSLLSRLYNRKTAHIAALLLAFSPWFLYTSASYMTHTASLVFSLGALYSVESARESRSIIWSATAGMALGALFLIRPLEGVIISIIIGIWSLGVWGKRLPSPAIATTLLVAVLVGSLHLLFNAELTGDPLYFPMERYFDEAYYPGANGLGFGPNKGNVGWSHIDPLPGHGLMDVIINSNQNMYLLNYELYGWGFGSLIFVLMCVVWRDLKSADWLMLAIILSIIAGNSLYFYSGAPDFGARYWYQVLIPMIVLTVRGAQKLHERLIENGVSHLDAQRLWIFVAAATLVAFISFVPRQAFAKYHKYRGMRADIDRLAETCHFDGALVFVQEQDKSDYPSAFIYNPVDLNSDQTIYVRDLGPEMRNQVIENFPNRSIWVVRGSEELGGNFTIIEGPLSPLDGEHLERPIDCQ